VSHFLTGLVRRGAGLPLPVTLRPARGSLQIAPSVPTAQPGREGDMQPPSSLPVPAGATQDIRNIEVRSVEPAPPMQLPARIPRDLGDRLSPRALGIAPVPAQSDSSPGPERRKVSPQRGAADFSSQHEPPMSHFQPRPRTPMTDVAEVREGGRKHPVQAVAPVTQPGPHRDPVASTSTISRGDAQERNIHVKIGRVEIRSNQPVPTVRQARRNGTRGFDDFKLSRNYFDRSAR
jgi:hypothetical protein